MELLRRTLLLSFLVILPCSSPASQNEFHRATKQYRLSDNKTSSVNTMDRLRNLRLIMKAEGVQGYIIPSEDAHQSEFVPSYLKRLEYITGFTGSQGVAYVTLTKSALLTDSRYFEQAKQELGSEWIILKKGTDDEETWLKESLQSGNSVGIDSNLISMEKFRELEQNLDEIRLVGQDENLIDRIWTVDRPLEPQDKIVTHDVKYAGESWESKVAKVREILRKKRVNGLVLSSLNEIAWLFNLRGKDVPFTPVFEAFTFLSHKEIRLYVKKNKITPPMLQQLKSKNCSPDNATCVQIYPYDKAYGNILEIVESLQNVLVPTRCNYALCGRIPMEKQVPEDSPVQELMSVKNKNELEGMREAHLKDAVSQVILLAEMEKSLKKGELWHELKVVERLQTLRRDHSSYRGDSFDTIAASGPNAAIVHYSPKPSTNRAIDTEHIFLLDTGGQYLEGTVDLTRTWHFGTPTEQEKNAFTRVLMGVINLFTLVFPEGVADTQVDILARAPLFEDGMEYGHGTGHGIGSYLGVHEYPPLISPGGKGNPLKEGMITSIEPGYYKTGKFGIRLETTAVVVDAKLRSSSQNKTFLKFEPIAFLPFEQKLIHFHLLSRKQITWLNWYNEKISQILGSELRKLDKRDALNWLGRKMFHYSVPKEAYQTSPNRGGLTFEGCSFLLLMTVIFQAIV